LFKNTNGASPVANLCKFTKILIPQTDSAQTASLSGLPLLVTFIDNLKHWSWNWNLWNLLPSLLHKFDLLPLESTHPYSTRRNSLIHWPLVRCERSRFSLRYSLIINYNKCKNNIKGLSPGSIKKTFKVLISFW